MARLDKIHEAVKNALIKDGWKITHDPFTIQYQDITVQADLGAERTIAAEMNGEKIAVEIKSFLRPSNISEFETALGQYRLYRRLLSKIEPERPLFLAVGTTVFQSFFHQKAIQFVIEEENVSLIVVDIGREGNQAMDKKLDYGKLLREILTEKINLVKPASKLAEILIADEENGIFAWQAFGWEEGERQSYQRFFARLQDSKIHIEEDWTEEGIGTILLEKGVPPKDIVIEFHPPEMRQYTEFALK